MNRFSVVFGIAAIAAIVGGSCCLEAQTTDVASSVPDAPGVIDGAKNPGAIPDDVAYRHLFRILAERENGLPFAARADALTYAGLTAVQIEEVIRAATDFERRSRELDDQANEIKNKNWPNPSSAAWSALEALDQKRYALIASILAALRARIGIEAAERLAVHVDTSMKPRIKLVPSRIVSGGSSAGQPSSAAHH